jgi:hypothetical protein
LRFWIADAEWGQGLAPARPFEPCFALTSTNSASTAFMQLVRCDAAIAVLRKIWIRQEVSCAICAPRRSD